MDIAPGNLAICKSPDSHPKHKMMPEWNGPVGSPLIGISPVASEQWAIPANEIGLHSINLSSPKLVRCQSGRYKPWTTPVPFERPGANVKCIYSSRYLLWFILQCAFN